VVIHDDIDELIEYGRPDDFCVVRDFAEPDVWFNSSVMRFNAEKSAFIWEEYVRDKKYFDTMHGDQNVITAILKTREFNIYPDQWIWSYKWGPVRGQMERWKSLPPLSKIAVFHGYPKPQHVKDAWVFRNWC
jgi:hypothetical protein